MSENIFKSFERDQPLITHWDGKMLEDIAGNETIDWLPVQISGHDKTQLLGVPKTDHETGKHAATVVCI